MISERYPCNLNSSAEVLRQPLTLKCGRTLRNRIMKAPLQERLATYAPGNLPEHGLPTQSHINMYEKWGNGGFAMVMTGDVAMEPFHPECAGSVVVSKENDSPKLRELLKQYSAACKSDGALAVMQISHAGGQTPITVNPNPKSPSGVEMGGVRMGTGSGKSTAFTEEEIQMEIIDRFVHAARVCDDTGFDGIQVHAAHSFLLAQFLLTTTNHRTDKYGGSAENRARLVVEVNEAVRSAVPSTFIVGLKLNSVEFPGLTEENSDSQIMCNLLEEANFDFVELTGGYYEQCASANLRLSTVEREAYYLEFIKRARIIFTTTPLFLTGGFKTVQWMSEAVSSGACDGVGLGRTIAAEPDLPKKILSGEVQSAAKSKQDQRDFMSTKMAATTQMWQGGLRSLVECGNDILADIMDLSDEGSAAAYTEALQEFRDLIPKKIAAGEVYIGPLNFYKNNNEDLPN